MGVVIASLDLHPRIGAMLFKSLELNPKYVRSCIHMCAAISAGTEMYFSDGMGKDTRHSATSTGLLGDIGLALRFASLAEEKKDTTKALKPAMAKEMYYFATKTYARLKEAKIKGFVPKAQLKEEFLPTTHEEWLQVEQVLTQCVVAAYYDQVVVSDPSKKFYFPLEDMYAGKDRKSTVSVASDIRRFYIYLDLKSTTSGPFLDSLVPLGESLEAFHGYIPKSFREVELPRFMLQLGARSPAELSVPLTLAVLRTMKEMEPAWLPRLRERFGRIVITESAISAFVVPV